MDKAIVIKEMVQKFVNDEKMFTSVDIGNAIKKETLSMDIRNRDVRDWLKANLNTDPILQDYKSDFITIGNGSVVATLYRPHWKDSEDYKDRDQKAFGPNDLKSSTTPAPAPGAPVTIGSIITAANIIKKCRYKRRIQISGAITRALGWVPGQKVDLDKVKIHTGTLKPGLTVWHDGRFSIPRNTVGYGQDPVKIVLKDDDCIYFEKA